MSDQQRNNQIGQTVTMGQYDPSLPATRPDGTVVPLQTPAEEILPPSPRPYTVSGDAETPTGKVRDGVFTCTAGRMAGEKISVFKVSPSLVQKVIQSVKNVKRPTYETRTFSGRVEVHPMDEVVAQQTPGYQGVWDQYIEDKAEMEAERNERLATVLLSRGTKYDLPTGWEEEHEALGLVIPVEPNAKRAHYLAVELDPEDLNDLVKEVLRLTGITEEKIKEAEASFRS